MTKQEKIKQAYGEHWEAVKDYVDENGWLNSKELYGDVGNSKRLLGLSLDIYNPYNPKYCYFKRPTSLSGIEDNNGWKNITSESDLPTEDGYYFTIIRANPKKKLITKYPSSSPDVDRRFWMANVLAFQPLVFPGDKVY